MNAKALACLPFFLLGACAAPAPDQRPEIGQVWTIQPGTGTVVGMTRAPAPLSAQSSDRGIRSGAGATAGGSPEGMYRLTLRMDDGRIQYIDTDSTEYTVGTRVDLGADRVLRKL